MQTIELVSEEQVLGAVKSNGPLIPMEVRQLIKAGDSITIGATLSTLAARGVVLITHIKRGGSPFYYLKGQEEKLANLSKYLGEKDRRTFEALKENKIMRDKAEEPLTRISLRNMPDFAKSMNVQMDGAEEIFWRWYCLSEAEALALIKSGKKEKEREEKNATPFSTEDKTTPAIISQQATLEKPQLKDAQNSEAKEEKIAKVKEEKQKPDEEKHKTEKHKEEFLEVRDEVQKQLFSADNPHVIAQFNDAFITKIGGFFASCKIPIKEAKQLKKGAEYDLVIDIPTPVGSVEYFCKAKSKKKCSEGDLSSAYLQAQNMRLPVLFATTGEVTKKAKEKLKTDFKGMIIKEI